MKKRSSWWGLCKKIIMCLVLVRMFLPTVAQETEGGETHADRISRRGSILV